jgi:hypothetical protein
MKRGPKTQEGKDKSRMNAMKHGLRATDQLFLAHLKQHERSVFEEVRTALCRDYRATTDLEKMIVDRIAIQHFRQFRLYQLEYVAESQSMRQPLADESILRHLDRFARYDSRIERQVRVLHNRLVSLYISRGDFSLTSLSSKD